MDTLAVQTLVGSQGSRAATELPDKFESIVQIGGVDFGLNSSGIYQLNTTEVGGSVTFASTDFGVSNPKQIRYIDLGVQAQDPFNVVLRADDGVERSYTVTPNKVGTQRIRVPVDSFEQGRYWELSVISVNAFRVDDAQAIVIVRSKGHIGV